THKGIVAVIADGVSTAEAGREASQACVQNLLYDYYCTPDTWDIQKSILTVLNALNRWLFSQGSHFQDTSKGFITTLSIVILKSSTAYIFHIGDSRVYRRREGSIECLTNDHTRQVGKVTYLARAMGLDNKIQLDYRREELQVGDQFILTTDGVHDFFPDKKWPKVFDEHTDIDDITRVMHETALENGSNDNLSTQIITVDTLAPSNKEEAYESLLNLPFPPLFEAGQKIDGLLIEKALYESTRSQLYIVRDMETQEQFVMKTPSINFEDDPAYIEQFISESWIGRKFRHNKLVKVIVPRVPPTCLYYLMEYAEGITLEQWMGKTNTPSLKTVVLIARQIGVGLRALHRQQVIHQDLKPGNIIIDDNEQIKLIDFGSCSASSMKELQQKFSTGGALGTASYSAPECHLGNRIDLRADVFSLAVIIFEVLTKRLPYHGKLETIKNESDLNKLQYQSAVQLNPYVPHWIDMALMKALSLHPDDRYNDVDELIFDLEHPNQKMIATHKRMPLLSKNPLRFWQALVLLQTFVIGGLVVKVFGA
ncbi:MAG: bifunctional protein-serine/threonine kinase/phosphatase, partial [Sinobacterium sp.]|nr:bifunctional protein-serine/threonine kinase/phosphatase [Sinobacterium sp.]